MCRNAKQFNEPGSTIYKVFWRYVDFLPKTILQDATFVMKYAQNRKLELTEKGWLAVDRTKPEEEQKAIDALIDMSESGEDQEGDEDSDDEPEDHADGSLNRDVVALYQWVRNAQPFIDAFLLLPSRR